MGEMCELALTCVFGAYCRDSSVSGRSMTFRSLEKGQFVFADVDDEVNCVILEGVGMQEVVFEEGAEGNLCLGLLGRGQVFGNYVSYRYKVPSQLRALTPMRICTVNAPWLLARMREKPGLFERYVMWGTEMQQYSFLTHRWVMSAPTLRKRVERLIANMCYFFRDAEHPEVLPFTHDDFALILNTDRPSVSNILKELQREGAIDLGYRKIVVGESLLHERTVVEQIFKATRNHV